MRASVSLAYIAAINKIRQTVASFLLHYNTLSLVNPSLDEILLYLEFFTHHSAPTPIPPPSPRCPGKEMEY